MLWIVVLVAGFVLLMAATQGSGALRKQRGAEWLALLASALIVVASLRFGLWALIASGPLVAWLLRGALRKAQLGGPQSGGGRRNVAALSREEALRVLGLTEGASAEQITTAHRNLIKKLHPDQGGSDFLAQQVNEAKAVLLSR